MSPNPSSNAHRLDTITSTTRTRCVVASVINRRCGSLNPKPSTAAMPTLLLWRISQDDDQVRLPESSTTAAAAKKATKIAANDKELRLKGLGFGGFRF